MAISIFPNNIFYLDEYHTEFNNGFGNSGTSQNAIPNRKFYPLTFFWSFKNSVPHNNPYAVFDIAWIMIDGNNVVIEFISGTSSTDDEKGRNVVGLIKPFLQTKQILPIYWKSIEKELNQIKNIVSNRISVTNIGDW